MLHARKIIQTQFEIRVKLQIHHFITITFLFILNLIYWLRVRTKSNESIDFYDTNLDTYYSRYEFWESYCNLHPFLISFISQHDPPDNGKCSAHVLKMNLNDKLITRSKIYIFECYSRLWNWKTKRVFFFVLLFLCNHLTFPSIQRNHIVVNGGLVHTAEIKLEVHLR